MTRTCLKRLVDNPVVRAFGLDLPYVALEHVESHVGRTVDGFAPETRNADDAVLFEPGDVLFGKLRPYLVKVLTPDYAGCASGEFLVLRPRRDLDSRFLYYLCLTGPFTGWANATSYGVKMPRTTWEAIGEFEVGAPPPREQRAIAGFLDREIALIDGVLAVRRRIQDLLDVRSLSLAWIAITGGNLSDERRSSGLAWLGAIPAAWSVAAVSRHFEVRLGRMLNPERAAGPNLAPYVRNANVRWDCVDVSDLAEMDFPHQDRERYMLEPGDVLINEGGAGMGRTAIWEGEIEECYFQKSVLRLRPSGYSNPRWLVECMRVAVAQKLFLVEGNVATIPHLPAETLRVHRFPFPPRTVQDRQLEWLAQERGELERTRDVIQRQIELLYERRQALITAAVTGQILVPKRAA